MKSWERDEHTHFDVMARFFQLAEHADSAHQPIQEELARYMRVRLSRGHWIPEDITQFHSEWYREFYRVLGVDDPYRDLKRRSTVFAQEANVFEWRVSDPKRTNVVSPIEDIRSDVVDKGKRLSCVGTSVNQVSLCRNVYDIRVRGRKHNIMNGGGCFENHLRGF